MIRRFTIRGFKRFERETAIDLDPVTVLVGANNSGKSTILEALTLFQYCVETARRANGNGRGNERNGRIDLARRSVSPDQFGVLPVAEPTDLWPNGRTISGKEQQAIELRAEYDSGAEIAFTLKLSYNRFSITPRSSGDVTEAVHQRDIRLIPVFSGFLPREEYLTLPARQERMRLQRHGEMVRNLLWNLRVRDEARWKTLIELLGELFPESVLRIGFDVDFDRFINAAYRDRALTRELDVVVTGSGFHQALQILVSVLTPGARVLLLDEPDAHLHARLQEQLMGIMVRLARDEQAQFILATHSPQLLSAAPEGSIRVCRDGTVVPLDLGPGQFRLLEDLGAPYRLDLSVRLWEANEIENYLLDVGALAGALHQQAAAKGVEREWRRCEDAFVDALRSLVDEQRERVRQAVATRIQNDDRSLALSTAIGQADAFLRQAWEEPTRWCDAKEVFRRLRAWLQERGLPLRIVDAEIIDAMAAVPDDVRKVLRELQRIANPRAARSRTASTSRASRA